MVTRGRPLLGENARTEHVIEAMAALQECAVCMQREQRCLRHAYAEMALANESVLSQENERAA